jgi:hypothetical protein
MTSCDTSEYYTGDLNITPGVRYNLKISLQPNDKYLSYRGYQAVRLSGMIWMRHNLGANLIADPDVPAQQINGDYYQFGRRNCSSKCDNTCKFNFEMGY